MIYQYSFIKFHIISISQSYFFITVSVPVYIHMLPFKNKKKKLICTQGYNHQNRKCSKRYFIFNKLLFSTKIFDFYEGNILGIVDHPRQCKVTVLTHYFENPQMIDKNQLRENLERIKYLHQLFKKETSQIIIKIHHYHFDEEGLYIVIEDLKDSYPLNKANKTLAALPTILKTYDFLQQQIRGVAKWDIYEFLIQQRYAKILCIPPLKQNLNRVNFKQQLSLKIAGLILRYASLPGYYYDKIPFNKLEGFQIFDAKSIHKKLSQISTNNGQSGSESPINQYLNIMFKDGIKSISANQLAIKHKQASKKLFAAIYHDQNHCKSPRSFPNSECISEEVIEGEGFRRVFQENERWIKFIMDTITEMQKVQQPEKLWEETRYCLHKKVKRHLESIKNHKGEEDPAESSNKSELAQQLGEQNRQKLSQIPLKIRQKQALEEKIKKNQEIFPYMHEQLGKDDITIDVEKYTSYKQAYQEYCHQLGQKVHQHFTVYLFSPFSKYIEENLSGSKEKLQKLKNRLIQEEGPNHKYDKLIRQVNLWIRLFFIKMEDNQEFIDQNKRFKYELNYLVEFIQSLRQMGQDHNEVIEIYIEVIDILMEKKFKSKILAKDQSHNSILKKITIMLIKQHD